MVDVPCVSPGGRYVMSDTGDGWCTLCVPRWQIYDVLWMGRQLIILYAWSFTIVDELGEWYTTYTLTQILQISEE